MENRNPFQERASNRTLNCRDAGMPHVRSATGAGSLTEKGLIAPMAAILNQHSNRRVAPRISVSARPHRGAVRPRRSGYDPGLSIAKRVWQATARELVAALTKFAALCWVRE